MKWIKHGDVFFSAECVSFEGVGQPCAKYAIRKAILFGKMEAYSVFEWDEKSRSYVLIPKEKKKKKFPMYKDFLSADCAVEFVASHTGPQFLKCGNSLLVETSAALFDVRNIEEVADGTA